MNEVFKEQVKMGIIERIDDLDELVNDSKVSFLAHMHVFKLTNDTTKCRIVYLANLVQTNIEAKALSHNQAIFPGPNLNKKISTASINLIFNEKLSIFDICKALLQIGLFPDDQNKMCLLWFKDVFSRDFSIVAYKVLRLPFGLHV